MHIEELDTYRVACHLNRRDLKDYGITVDDLVNRSPLAHLFFRSASKLAKEKTGYTWPGCAMSMEMKFLQDDIVVIFSERIDDYIYNLKQTAKSLDAESAKNMQEMITMLAMTEEDEARNIIRRFEQNVREVQK